MTDSDLAVSILREIRDEIRGTNQRIDRLDERLTGRIDSLNERIESLGGGVDVLNERVSLVEHAIKDSSGQILLLTRYLKTRTERDIDDLRERVGRLEAKP